MYKLEVGLGYSVFQLFLRPLRQGQQDIVNCLSKQRTVLSDRILEYYRINAGELSDLVDEYVTANAGYDCFQFFSTGLDKNTSIEEEFVTIVSQCPMKQMVADEKEFAKRLLKGIRVSNINEVLMNKNHPLRMYSLPISNYEVNEGEKRDRYLAWFKNLMKGELSVRIIDQYIITDKGIKVLNEVYLPLIEEGAQVEIFGTDSNIQNGWTAEELNKRIDRTNHKIQMYIIPRDEEHDRFICAGNIRINIGRGLDFVDSKHEEIQKKTYISISVGGFVRPRIIREVKQS